MTPIVGVGDATISEGTSAGRSVAFSVSLDHPATSDVGVQYRVAAGTATAGSDFAAIGVRTLWFKVGSSGLTPVAKQIAVKVLPDVVDEPDETFTVELLGAPGAQVGRAAGRGVIRDDDPIGPGYRASVSDGSLVEGDQGNRTIAFTVALSAPAPAPVSVDYSVRTLSATAPTDVVVNATKRLSFAVGARGLTPVSKTVSVVVRPDDIAEGDETFAVVLSNPSVGMLLADPTGIGTIIDDEPARRPLMGTAVRWPTLGNVAQYADTAGRRFDVVTPENELKWDLVEPAQGVFNFAVADAIVDFAQSRGQTVHGHALAWYAQNPAWLTNGSFTRDQLIAILTNHITTVVGRYRGRVSAWDVVNEAVTDDGALRSTVWSTGIGPDYLDIAFRAAHAADPGAALYLNDYNIEGPGTKSDALYDLAAGLVARGVPIDGVGFQAHLIPGSVSEAGLAGQFQRYVGLGLEVAVTELDVRVPVPASQSSLATQAATYAIVRDACVATPECASLTTWGFTDAFSWIPSWFPGYGAALPWDAAYAPKPAYDVLAPLLRN